MVIVLQIWDEVQRTILLTFASEYLPKYSNVVKVQRNLFVDTLLTLVMVWKYEIKYGRKF